MNTELQGASRAVLLAIFRDEDAIPVTAPQKAAAIGALKKRGLITKRDGRYVTTDEGAALAAAMDEPPAAKPAAKKADPAPKHNDRTMGYVTAVRAAMPGLAKTDDEIAAVVWRVASTERALAKAREAFAVPA